MERCVLVKRSLAMAGLSPSRRVCRPSPTSFPSSSSSPPSSSSSSAAPSRRCLKVMAMASSEDFGLQWQPVFSFEQADLMTDAPSLLKTCEGFDWQAQVIKLRTLAKLSMPNTPTSNQNQALKPLSKDLQEGAGKDNGDTWFVAGLALVTTALIQCSFHLNAFAAEESAQTAEAAEAASRAPAWLTPALLAFPVVTYVMFSVYRSQVNPGAKVTDWMFGVAAAVIIANLVLISTIGVRLY
eukprot:c16290_g1_i1 orf=120-839(+)